MVVELDGENNLDAEGNEKTSFNPGDEPQFLVHFDPAQLRIDRVRSSSGMCVSLGEVARLRDQQVSFTNADDTQELSYIPAGGVVWSWYGNSPAIQVDYRKLTVVSAGAVPAIGKAVYGIKAQSYKLIPPPLDLSDDQTWPILVVITMEAA